MKSIDYSAFATPISEAEIVAYKNSIQGKWMVTSKVPMWLCFAAAAALFATMAADSVLGRSTVFAGLGGLGVVLGVTAICIGLVMLALYIVSKQRTRYAKFAASNNATYIYNQQNPALQGLIFDEGHSRVLKNAIVFADTTQLGEYQYVTGSGKNRQVHNWTFIRIPLPRRLPNMVLDAKKNNIFGMISNLPDSFTSGQKLSLEGDFDKHFTLYAPQQYATDALYIFTPDVMQAVIDYGGGYDMEVVDDSLYVYTQNYGALSKQESIQKLVAIAQKVGGEISDQASFYRDERVGNPAMNMVALPGQRLQSKVSVIGVVLLVLYILYIISHVVRP